MLKEEFLEKLHALTWDEKKVLYFSCKAQLKEAETGIPSSEKAVAAQVGLDYLTYDEILNSALNKVGFWPDASMHICEVVDEAFDNSDFI